tara:strand:+ start:4467 stop:4691 length:225 start_codon:yes stop_codon:yes gene_type:complete
MLAVALPVPLARCVGTHARFPTHACSLLDTVIADFYYKTEWIYSFLSAGSKITLGLLLYVSVSCHASVSVRDMN